MGNIIKRIFGKGNTGGGHWRKGYEPPAIYHHTPSTFGKRKGKGK